VPQGKPHIPAANWTAAGSRQFAIPSVTWRASAVGGSRWWWKVRTRCHRGAGVDGSSTAINICCANAKGTVCRVVAPVADAVIVTQAGTGGSTAGGARTTSISACLVTVHNTIRAGGCKADLRCGVANLALTIAVNAATKRIWTLPTSRATTVNVGLTTILDAISAVGCYTCLGDVVAVLAGAINIGAAVQPCPASATH